MPGGPPGGLGGLHHAARAKRVIFLFMNGAPSHVDTFDPKPLLAKHEGESPSDDIAGKNRAAGYMPSPFRFAPHGESGVVMSELFPNLARHADDLCVIRSMHTDVPNHEPGLLLDAIGAPAADSAEHGLMAFLRTGDRKRKPSLVHRSQPWSSRGGAATVVQCVPAGSASGRRSRYESHRRGEADR